MPNIFFIRIKENQVFEYPITLENMQQCFGNFDINNPPEGYVRYYKIDPPDKTDRFTYYGDIYPEYNGKEVWEKMIIRPYTDEERVLIKDEITDYFELIQEGDSSQWIYNEEEGMFFPPCDPPTDGVYKWDNSTGYWKRIGDWQDYF
ncbi:MAG: hypothetical protein EBX47_11815 [Synechococcaceae bacterium WB8_1B_057]|nr:hypothetical protein [Synechococcaceae bacterium WB6_1A_059]NDG80084.1 hypothetical protein [Synechococcaceae bacterium WB8_1B_057]